MFKKSTFDNFKANPKSTSSIFIFFGTQAVSLFQELKSLMTFAAVKSAESKFDLAEKVRQ